MATQTYTVKYDQNIFDVALQIYGDTSGIADLLSQNADLNLGSDIKIGDTIYYDDGNIVNSTVSDYFDTQGIVVANGVGNVYAKYAREDIKLIMLVDKIKIRFSWQMSGSGTVIVDWGDNSEVQTIVLSDDSIKVSHDMDSTLSDENDYRKIKLYGDFDFDKFYINSSDIYKIFAIDNFDVNNIIASYNNELDSIGFFDVVQNTSSINIENVYIDSLLPLISQEQLRDLWINDASLTQETLDNYFISLVTNYEDRPACQVRMWGNSSPSGIYQRPEVLFDPQTGLEAMWVLENERGWTINEIIAPPLESTIIRRFTSRDGCKLIDDNGISGDYDVVSSYYNGVNSYTVFPTFNFLEGKFVELNIDLSKATVGQYLFGSSVEPEVGLFINDLDHNKGRLERIKIVRTSKSEFTINNEDGHLGVISNEDWGYDFLINLIGKRGDDSLFFKGAMSDINFNDEIHISFPHLRYCESLYSDYTLITPYNVSLTHSDNITDGSIALPVSKFTSFNNASVITSISAASINRMSFNIFLEYMPDKQTTIIGAKDNVNGSKVSVNLNVDGRLEFVHGTSNLTSADSIFDYQDHLITINAESGGAKCYIDDVLVGTLDEQLQSTDAHMAIGCLVDSDGNETNFSNVLLWNVIFGNDAYNIPLPHLGYDVVTGAYNTVNNVVEYMLNDMYGGIRNNGGCDWLQIYGAVARSPNLSLNGYAEKIGDGSIYEYWSETILDSSLASTKIRLSCELKVNQDAADNDVYSRMKVYATDGTGTVIGSALADVGINETVYGKLSSEFLFPSDALGIKIAAYHTPDTTTSGNVYSRYISITKIDPEFIPNGADGESTFPLLTGDTFIAGSDFLNQTPFDVTMNGGDIEEKEYMWDKSRTDVWGADVRSSDSYDISQPKKWGMSELTQQFIVNNINSSFLYIPWIKIDAGDFKDIFQYPIPLVGDDKDRCNRYVHLYI